MGGYALEIGYQGLHGGSRVHPSDRLYGLGPDDGTHILEVVPVHGGEHGMFDSHDFDGSGHFFGLGPVHGLRPAGPYPAKPAGTGADIAQDHKGGRTLSSTFPHIGTAARGTDGVQLV